MITLVTLTVSKCHTRYSVRINRRVYRLPLDAINPAAVRRWVFSEGLFANAENAQALASRISTQLKQLANTSRPPEALQRYAPSL